MVDEVDQHGQIDQEERFGDGDREMRDEISARFARDGAEGQHGVHEGAYEHAQSELVTEVAHEVPHHAGPKLLGGKGQGHNGDREHHSDHSDDAGGDGDQDFAARVRATCPDPKRQSKVAVVSREIDRERNREQRCGHEDQYGRDQPEVGPQRFAPPTRQSLRKRPVAPAPLASNHHGRGLRSSRRSRSVVASVGRPRHRPCGRCRTAARTDLVLTRGSRAAIFTICRPVFPAHLRRR